MNSEYQVKLTRNHTDVFLVETRNIGQEQMDRLRGILDPDETARSQRFRFRRDHDSFVAVHGLLRLILGFQLGISPRAVKFEFSKYGKPLLTGQPDRIHFSLSHSRDASALAFSMDDQIGVDLEYMDPDFDYQPVAGQFFSQEENVFINAGTNGASDRFYRLWTRKEALLKGIGTGLSGKLDVDVICDISTVHPENEREAISGPHRFSLFSTLFANNYMVSIASGNVLSGIRFHLPSESQAKLI